MSAGLPGYDKAALRFFIILWNLKNILKRGDGMLEKFFSLGKANESEGIRGISEAADQSSNRCSFRPASSGLYGCPESDPKHEIAGAPFDLYIKTQFDSLSPEDWETEVYFPIKKDEMDG